MSKQMISNNTFAQHDRLLATDPIYAALVGALGIRAFIEDKWFRVMSENKHAAREDSTPGKISISADLIGDTLARRFGFAFTDVEESKAEEAPQPEEGGE